MTLYESNPSATLIAMSEAEEDLVRDVFSAYPLVANESRELTKSDGHEDLQEDTELLRSSIAEHNQLSRVRLDKWLADPDTFRRIEEQRVLTIKTEDTDWMLQILNDLRIGSWQQLDCPSQEELSQVSLNSETFRPLCTMEFSGILQSILLSQM